MSGKKFFETSEFKKLQKEWAKKLEASGFDDIEKNEDERIVRPQEFTTPHIDSSLVEYVEFVENAGLDFYQFCHQILREYPFKKELDRVVFEQYTEGKTQREIVDYLAIHGPKKISQPAVFYIIEKVLAQKINLDREVENITDGLNALKTSVAKDVDSLIVKPKHLAKG